jgi:hypothetical protein
MDLWTRRWRSALCTRGLTHGGGSPERSPHSALGSQSSSRRREKGDEPTGDLTGASVGGGGGLVRPGDDDRWRWPNVFDESVLWGGEEQK